jgi:hypothetical protein
MGWSSGSSLMSDVIHVIKFNVTSDTKRQDIYFDIIQDFENYDCDTLMECCGQDTAFDAALKERHPDWF